MSGTKSHHFAAAHVPQVPNAPATRMVTAGFNEAQWLILEAERARAAERIAALEAELERARAPAAPVPPPPVYTPPPAPLRLDLGCGTRKAEGFTGVDVRAFPGVDVVCDLGTARWPFEDCSVDEVQASHLVEHFTAPQRIHFANELYRVLKPGGKAIIVTPHWCSHRAYGDLTHQWPPVSEMWFGYLNAEWRKVNAPHNDGYSCDFAYPPSIGYAPHPGLVGHNPERMQHELTWFRDAAQDMSATLTKPVRP